MSHQASGSAPILCAHLLDTALRKLSMVRDAGDAEAASICSPQDLVALVNRLNREGVTVHRRLSPSVLDPHAENGRRSEVSKLV